MLDKLERDLALLRPADRMAILAFDGARIQVLCGWTGVATEEQDGRRSSLSGPTLQVVIATLPEPGTYARFQTAVRLRDPGQRVIFTIHDAVTGQALWGEGQAGPAK